MKKKRKKSSVKDKLSKVLKSYKTIIYISFIINIILLFFTYYILTNNKLYTFSGSDEYIEVKDGMIALNNDINVINNNNVKYVSNNDYDIKSYKIGYYVMDDTKLIEIVSNSLELDTEMKLSDIINNLATYNVSEKNRVNSIFTSKVKKLLDDNLYLVIEAKTSNGESILSKVKLNVTKITKY